MPTTAPTDAVVVPQDPGTGTPEKDDPNSAAALALIGEHRGGAYVSSGLKPLNIDTTNDTVDITGGVCYVVDNSDSTVNSRSAAGNAQLQSANGSGYDTDIGTEQVYVIVLPTDVTGLGLDASAQNILYVSVDPSAQNSTTIHATSGVAPTNPHVQVGRVDSGSGEWNVLSRDSPTTKRHVSSWSDARIGGEKKTVPKPEFAKSPQNPLLEGTNVGWTSQLNMPSFFHAGGFLDNPLGEYYNYYSSHSTAGLGLLWADSLDGAWTDEGRVSSTDNHPGESDAIWIPELGRPALYANQGNTFVSRYLGDRTDGTTWTYDQDVRQSDNHTGYPRVFRHGDRWYMCEFNKDIDSVPGNEYRALYESPNGTEIFSWTHVHRTAGYKESPSGSTGGGSNTYWSHFDYLPWFGGYLVCYTDKRGADVSKIRLGYTEDGLRIDDWGVALDTTETWEASSVRYPNLFWAGDRLGLFYAAGDNGNGKAIALGLALDVGVTA